MALFDKIAKVKTKDAKTQASGKNPEELILEMEELRRHISEQKTTKVQLYQAQKLLEEEKEKAQQYLDIAGVIFLAIDTDGIVTMVNRKACEVLGYDEHEIIGKNWFDNFLPEPHKSEVIPISQKLLSGELKSAEYFENPVLTKKGEERLIAWHNTYIKDRTGKIIGHLSSGEDITERKKAEIALRKSEEKYRNVIEHANEAIFIAQDWVIRFPNPKTIDLMGYSEEELANTPFVDIIHPDDRQMVAERHKQRLSGEKVEEFYSFRIISKKGETQWIEIKPVRIMWDNRPATLNFVADITARKKSETENKKLEEQLFRAQKMEALGTLAGGIAHDFNNILSAIHGYTELCIFDLPNNHSLQINLRHILDASDRAKEMVNQILAFSRKNEQERSPVYIGSIILEVEKLLRISFPSTIKIIVDIRDAPTPVISDKIQLYQVIMNLCTNAAHAMRDQGGSLLISLCEVTLDHDAIEGRIINPGKYQKLSVSDTGCGMSDETKRRLFDPYFTTKQPGEGSGLGLAVVHGIVKSHKGEITFHSELGKGSSFSIFFPVIEMAAETKQQQVQEAKNPIAPEVKHRVLFVDDDPILVNMVTQMLEKIGCSVESQNSTTDTLKIILNDPTRFDVVITDQTMPNITGLELAKEIKAINPHLPVILCTGFSEEIDEKNFRAKGVDAFLMKPISMTEIAEVIRKVLQQS